MVNPEWGAAAENSKLMIHMIEFLSNPMKRPTRNETAQRCALLSHHAIVPHAGGARKSNEVALLKNSPSVVQDYPE